MNSGMRITASADGATASISLLSASVTEDEITAELTTNNIRAGIDRNAIRAAVATARTSGVPVDNIVVARSAEKRIGLIFDLGGGSRRQDGETLLSRFSETARIIDSMKTGASYTGEHRAIFVRQGQQFLFEEKPEPFTDIYGTALPGADKPFFIVDECISVQSDGKRLLYTAEKSGYATFRRETGLSIDEPFITDESRMAMDCLFLPCEWDFKSLQQTLASRTAGEAEGQLFIADQERLRAITTSGRSHRLPFRKGTPATLSQNARIELMVHQNAAAEATAAGKIDQRKRTPFIEITGETIIAVKILPHAGTPGTDVYGNEIPVAPPLDLTFHAGTNVTEREEYGRLVYIAACDGFLTLGENSAAISEALVIDGDVDYSTGNVTTEKDVTVKGTVIGGFSVKSGGAVSIGGSIEDGSSVKTKGNLSVHGGVFGNRTVVESDGDADISFIQEGVVRVRGSLTVRKFIYGGKVFCGKKLFVEGAGVSGTERGCVLGGEIIAMESMELASAGSPTMKTHLYCGVNHEVITTIASVRSQIVSLNRRATSLRYSIPVDIDAPDAVTRLAALQPHVKEKVRRALLELRKVTEQLRFITGQLPLLERQQYTTTPADCRITVKKQCTPQIDIHLITDTLAVREEMHGVTLEFDTASKKIRARG